MSKLTIGGQAVMEGVMMRSTDKYAIAVRTPEDEITTKIIPIKKQKRLERIPIIRGIIRFAQTIIIGIKSLEYSASVSIGEDESLSTLELLFTLTLSIGLTILLFYIAPLFLARFLIAEPGLWFNLIDGLLRILIFLLYLGAISLLPDIQRIFQYHGAEHMTVHAYEKGEKLTIKNIRKYTTLHPRCGTNFILIVFLVSILVFSFINAHSFLQRLGYRLLLLPLIAGVSYEFLRFAGKYIDNRFVRISIYPGLLLQRITTKKPNDKMIEVAIAAINAVL